MKRAAAALITGLLLAGALLLGERGARRSAEPSSTARQCIKRMFDAAQRGDVDAYLDCFADPQRARIERKLADLSREAFAQTLRDAVRPMKGFAVIGGEESPAADRVELSVDRVYAHRNERQRYQLVRRSGQWRICDVAAAESVQPPIPYGTPVYEAPPADEASGETADK